MNIRAVIVIVLATSSCRNLPFLSHHAASSTSGNADGDASDLLGAGEQSDAALDGASADVTGGDFFPGLDAADAPANSTNATESIAIDDAGVGAFSIPVPWDLDAGVGSDALPFRFPSPASLPPASATSQALALGGDPGQEVGADGCGEPPTCYLRTTIATAQGHVYSVRMSKSYPKDSCVTTSIDSDGTVLVGDSNARFSDIACDAATPQITLGFLVSPGLFSSWQSGQVWESTSGFRSEWTLADAGDDSGAYEPIPGRTSKLWPAWSRFNVGGEIYGELLVPLRHTVKHTLAIGFALFDIRVRH